MRKDMTHETSANEPREPQTEKTTDHCRIKDDRPTECGLTREELRVIVAEMIG